MSNPIIKNDRIVVDLCDQKISKLPIEDSDELEGILIDVAEKLSDYDDIILNLRIV